MKQAVSVVCYISFIMQNLILKIVISINDTNYVRSIIAVCFGKDVEFIYFK